MKILIDATAAFCYRDTGIGAYAEELLNALAQTEHGHDILVYTGEGILPLSEQAALTRRTDRDFWERAAKGAFQPRGFDLCHNLQNGVGITEAGGKSVVTIHDMIPQVAPEFCGMPYREIFLREAPKAAKAADGIITVSRHSKGDILRYTEVERERIHVIYEGPKTCCEPLPREAAEKTLRFRYGVEPPFFLYVGGFNPRKNLGTLLKAYAEGYRRFPFPCPLVIVGPAGARRDTLKRTAETLGLTAQVHFTGGVPDGDLPLFYSCCEAMIYPSLYEGFGLPPLEAAACGAVPIVAKASSLPEIMGDGAIYFPPDRPDALGKVLLRILTDARLKADAAKKALARAGQFSFQKAAGETLAVYENICR